MSAIRLPDTFSVARINRQSHSAPASTTRLYPTRIAASLWSATSVPSSGSPPAEDACLPIHHQLGRRPMFDP